MKKLLTFFVAMIASISLMAQVTSSNISGKVTDGNKVALAGATVVATHTPSGSQYYSVADANGAYRLLNIRPGGPYKIEVRMVGFQTTIQEGISATLGETKILNFKMQEESIGLGEVTIAGEAIPSGMDSDRAGATTAITSEQINNLPTVTRNLNDVLSLTPQAASNTSGLAIGGGNYRQSYVTVDGAAFNNAFGIGQNLPSNGSPISLDALEQMTINVTPFDVRQSGFTGGAINAVTKSGTNEWHATVYDFFQNNNLKGYYVNDNALTNTYSLNNTTGFSVGGPIVKNKLFFFINAEYTADNLPGSNSVARTTESQAFGEDVNENRPTVEMMDEIKGFLAENFNGYNPGRYQGYSLSTPDYKVLARLDWNINDNNKLNIRFSNTHSAYSNNPSSSMSPLGATNTNFTYGGINYSFNRYSEGRQSAYALPFESARYLQEQNFMSAAAELNTRVMAGRGNNMVRLAWSHQYEPRSFQGGLFPTVDILSNEGCADGRTAMYTSFGPDPFTYGNLRDVQTAIATDEFSWATGIHNFTAGLQYEWNRTQNGFMQGGAGWYIYNSWDDFKNDVLYGNAAPALYMITHGNNNELAQMFPSFDYAQGSAYFQDEMNLSEYFKLAVGLRLEMPYLSNPNNNYNKEFAEGWDETVVDANGVETKVHHAIGDATETSFAGLSTADLPNLRVSVSPRIGFNWDVLHNRNLILRGGSGLFTGRIPFVWMVSAMGNANVLQNQYIANASTGLNPIHFHQDINAQLEEVYGGAFQAQDLAAPTAATIISKDLKMPSAWKSSLGLDAKLPGGIKATVEGIFSYNYNEVYASQLGYKQAGEVTLDGEHQARQLWESENVKNSTGAKMTGYYLHNESQLHGYYYSVNAQLSKNFSNGLGMMAAYTHSNAKSLSDGSGDQISEFVNTYNVNGNNAPELGYSNYVAPNRVIANLNYTFSHDKLGTNVGLFYEGFNIGFFSGYSYSRVSYVMNNVSGTSAYQLLYIPTNEDLNNMNFVSEENKEAFKSFIENDAYMSTHRGQYEQRNAIVTPWLNRINFHIAQDFNFKVAGKTNTIEVAADIKNIGNLLYNKWGSYKVLSNNVVLDYATDADGNGTYTFTEPTWKDYANTASTWSAVLSLRYKF
ncbi:MAG: carboxypeptidase regulatory-like domain-containing protein [Bacteroidales bacterium]|nr:carboxypeptidase regulatory-like domain-containing protein [Bacteroidales bacterium]